MRALFLLPFRFLLPFVLAASSPVCRAAVDAMVEAVQAPAWLERAGSTRPLAPGLSLAAGDRLRTGVDSRIYLKLADGSRVKLGENASFVIESVATRRDGVFAAAFQVLAGAFRFTTGLLAKPRPREVSIRVATITAGVRGTDLWGKSDATRDLVCLLEGQISVRHPSGVEATMSQPNTFFVAPRGEPPQPIASVEPAQVLKWATETEIAAGKGAAALGGKWKVALASGVGEDEAFGAYQRARAAGYAAELHPRPGAPGTHVYDVILSGLPDAKEAQGLAARVAAELGLRDSKVTR